MRLGVANPYHSRVWAGLCKVPLILQRCHPNESHIFLLLFTLLVPLPALTKSRHRRRVNVEKPCGVSGQFWCPLTPALEVVAQVARALVAAEAQELVHRDLKPANLMLARA